MSDDRRQETEKAQSEGIRDVTDLAVYRKAYAVSLEIHHMSMALPKHEWWIWAMPTAVRSRRGNWRIATLPRCSRVCTASGADPLGC